MNEFEAAYRKIRDQERRVIHDEIQERAMDRPDEDRVRWSKGHRFVLAVLRMLIEDKCEGDSAVTISRLKQAILEQNPAFPEENCAYKTFREMLEDMEARGSISLWDDGTCQLAPFGKLKSCRKIGSPLMPYDE